MYAEQPLYDALWDHAFTKFQQDKFELDTCISDPGDPRRGITLLARFSDSIATKVATFLKQARSIEPGQYYYPATDFHLTVLSIITCHAGFSLQNIDSESYVAVIRESVQGAGPIKVCFRGLTASPSCIMLQGFPLGDELGRLRERVRSGFKNSRLQSSIDSRYAIRTAHSTVIRFQKPVKYKKQFLDFTMDYREHDFGTLIIDDLELVFNDWYQKIMRSKKLYTFHLTDGQASQG